MIAGLLVMDPSLTIMIVTKENLREALPPVGAPKVYQQPGGC